MRFKFKLGAEAEDKVTGFKGIIVGRIEYLYGCTQYGIKPQELHNKETIDVTYFDEGRIKIIGKGIHAKEVTVKEKGCENHSDAPKKK